ncbi:MAG: glycoside hydrolase family 3 protein, partial [bacterium]|nr:glycoside hydrolase family 3 protein [bacterium]
LREKIGQMLLLGFRGTEPAECDLIVRDLREHHIGSLILFDQEMAGGTIDSGPRRRNIVSPDQVRRLLAHLQAQAAVPLLVAIDQEGGRVNRLKPDYGFPASVSHEELGRLDQPAETYRQAALTAQTLASLGFNLNLAPVVDLDANPNNPIIKGKRRSFSSDPEAVARHAAEFVKAHRAHGVLCCAKHFPGHGSAAGDTHLGLVDVTATWHERELIPFQRLIQADRCDVIMSAHVINRRLDANLPATLSPAVQTGLLRGQLGFRGVITSDDLEMKAISSHYGLEESVLLAVEAGIDVLCFGNNMNYDPAIAAKVVAIIERGVTSGRLSEARINDSCERVLALKRRVGIVR